MKEKPEYDLIILGGGAAAFAAANRANQMKKRTLLINAPSILPLGGTCVNVGCVPSKLMLHLGLKHRSSVRDESEGLGTDKTIDFVRALEKTRATVVEMRRENYINVIEKQEFIGQVEGKAVFVDDHTVSVNDNLFKGNYFLIATGASKFIPPIPGFDDIEYLTNKNIFELKKQPRSLIVYGAGPEGMEIAQIFNLFGTNVTVIQRSGRILSKHDSLVSKELQKHLEAEEIKIETGCKVKEMNKIKDGVEFTVLQTDERVKKFVSDTFYLATGLNPNTKDINLERANVEITDRGFIKINEYMQTSKEHIYAAGDVTGLFPLETVAAKQGNLAVLNMFMNAGRTINYQEVPHAVFTSPEVAAVGISEDEYMKENDTCLCSSIWFKNVEKANLIGDTRGLIKMVLDHNTKEVVGVHIVGPMAADIITTASYAIRNKMTVDDIRDTVHVFPTLSECIKKVAQSFYQSLDDMPCCSE